MRNTTETITFLNDLTHSLAISTSLYQSLSHLQADSSIAAKIHQKLSSGGRFIVALQPYLPRHMQSSSPHNPPNIQTYLELLSDTLIERQTYKQTVIKKLVYPCLLAIGFVISTLLVSSLLIPAMMPMLNQANPSWLQAIPSLKIGGMITGTAVIISIPFVFKKIRASLHHPQRIHNDFISLWLHLKSGLSLRHAIEKSTNTQLQKLCETTPIDQALSHCYTLSEADTTALTKSITTNTLLPTLHHIATTHKTKQLRLLSRISALVPSILISVMAIAISLLLILIFQPLILSIQTL